MRVRLGGPIFASQLAVVLVTPFPVGERRSAARSCQTIDFLWLWLIIPIATAILAVQSNKVYVPRAASG